MQRLRYPRLEHTATEWGDGRALVTGGYIPRGPSHDPEAGEYLDRVEVWTPGGEWREIAPLLEARAAHTATGLPDGRVLVAGGKGQGAKILRSAEILNPEHNRWEPIAPMKRARYEHAACALPGGRVLVVGGAGEDGELASAEIYDPAENCWTMSGKLRVPRQGPEAICLGDGRVLVTGGVGLLRSTAPAELWSGGQWESAGKVRGRLVGHTMTLLEDGRIFLAGGEDEDATNRTQLYDGGWNPGPRLCKPRAYHTAVALPDGRVALIGGKTSGYDLDLLDCIEVWDGTGTRFRHALKTPRAGHRSLLIGDQVLVIGGHNYDGDALDSAELVGVSV